MKCPNCGKTLELVEQAIVTYREYRDIIEYDLEYGEVSYGETNNEEMQEVITEMYFCARCNRKIIEGNTEEDLIEWLKDNPDYGKEWNTPDE